ncbi:MAG TPA: hypothetical protein VHU92_01330 [Streptosporangiaceae bacterium]|nr:hypothetical protein [Streptosporangiaceae bacterium]
MIIILLAVGALAVIAPVACLVLVSIASMREDVAHSLGYQPAGAMQRAARRLLGFHGDGLRGRPGAPGQEWLSNNGRPADSGLADQPDLRDLVG